MKREHTEEEKVRISPYLMITIFVKDDAAFSRITMNVCQVEIIKLDNF